MYPPSLEDWTTADPLLGIHLASRSRSVMMIKGRAGDHIVELNRTARQLNRTGLKLTGWILRPDSTASRSAKTLPYVDSYLGWIASRAQGG